MTIQRGGGIGPLGVLRTETTTTPKAKTTMTIRTGL
jgi:hypothetical protein